MDFERLKWSFKSGRKKQKLLKAACDRLRLWPETAALLELCETQGIGIKFNEALLGSETDGLVRRNRTTGEVCIELKPCSRPEDLALALIHELRHVWQDRQLGLTPEKAHLGEPDARTALLLCRVREADAFAFTDLMIGRINAAGEDSRAADALEKTLRGGGMDAGRCRERAEDFLAARIADRVATESRETARRFLTALTWLDSYDRETLGSYFNRYIQPDPVTGRLRGHGTEKAGPETGQVDLPALRRLLKTGTAAAMPPYLAELDDRDFAAAVLRDVDPKLRAAADLMAAFENAAAQRASGTELALQRRRIDHQLRHKTPK